MTHRISKILFCLLLFLGTLSLMNSSGLCLDEAKKEPLYAIYITGIGCGNCAVTDPVLLTSAIISKSGS